MEGAAVINTRYSLTKTKISRNFLLRSILTLLKNFKNRTYNRPRKATLSKTTVRGGTVKSIIESNAEEEDPVLLKRQMKKLKKKRKRAYNELNARIEREEKLQATVNHLELRKQLHAGGRRRKVKRATAISRLYTDGSVKESDKILSIYILIFFRLFEY